MQNFRATGRTPMRASPEPGDDDIAHAVAMARLVLDAEVSVQAPPNLNAEGVSLLASARLVVPACIILDVHIPGRSGLDILKQLNAQD